MSIAWRYEPIDPRVFPVGEGPFRARGLAYASALRYVDKKLPGGRAAFTAALGPRDPYAGFYDQLFLAISDYDLSPLVRLYAVAARVEGVPTARFIEERARWSGGADPKGVWRQPLKGSTPEEVAERLYFAFNRYFPPCHAEPLRAAPGQFTGELSKLPACMNGLYAQSTIGFFIGAMRGAGAHEVRVEFSPPMSDGLHAGVQIERARFAVRWS